MDEASEAFVSRRLRRQTGKSTTSIFNTYVELLRVNYVVFLSKVYPAVRVFSRSTTLAFLVRVSKTVLMKMV